MKPSFALNITRDSIELLHRTSRGWLEVGSVAIDAPDLAEALGYLRGSALGLEPHGVTTKLVIPNSQILYTTVTAPGPDTASRERQIRAALEGRTPYAVADLVFDWSGNGPQVQVAVIARETLDEAEAFATEHRFNPLSFVAIPEPGAFAGEPWFGPSAAAPGLLPPGDKVERDQEPVQIVARDAFKPAPAPAPTVADVAAAPASPAPKKAPAPATVAQNPPPAPPTMAEKSAEPAKTDPGVIAPRVTPPMRAPEPAPAPALTGKPEGHPSATPKAAPSNRQEPPAERRAVEPEPATELPAPTFASRRVKPDAAKPGTADPDTPKPAVPAPATASPAPALGGAERRPADPTPQAAPGAKSVGAALDGAVPPAPPRPGPVAEPTTAKVVPPKEIATKKTALKATDSKAPSPKWASPAEPPRAKSEGFAKMRSAEAPAGKKQRSGFSDRIKRRETTQPDLAALAPTSKTAQAATSLAPASVKRDEAEAMTVFGARKSAVRGKPKYLGLTLTAILLLFLALIALWSKVYLASWISPSLTEVAVLEPDAAIPANAPDALLQLPDAAPADTFEAVSPSDIPGSAETDIALPEVVTQDPYSEAAADGQEEIDFQMGPDLAGSGDETGALDAELADLSEPEIAQPEVAGTDPDPDLPEVTMDAATLPPSDMAAGLAPEEATNLPVAEPAPDVPLADAAPDTTRNPTAEPLDEIYLASIDPGIVSKDAVALAEVPLANVDLAPESQLPPPPFGTFYQFDANGLIVPTPDGIVTPEGVRLVAGPPPVVPPLRPAAIAAPAAQTATPEADPLPAAPVPDPALAGARPRSRPESLIIPTQDDAALGTAAPVRLATLRPRSRPQITLAAATTAAVQVALQEAEADTSSALAIAVSRRPAQRPSDFSQAVQAALASAIRAPANPGASDLPEAEDEPELASVAPAIPTRASVAKQATFSNAINLSKTNLIGVYGTQSNRYALIRQSNGKYVKVKVGDRIDGGKVAAISDKELRYLKNGKMLILALPQG